MPTPMFAEWWNQHQGQTGNAYSARVAFVAVRCFCRELESMSISARLKGGDAEAARMAALNRLIKQLGLRSKRPVKNK